MTLVFLNLHVLLIVLATVAYSVRPHETPASYGGCRSPLTWRVAKADPPFG